MKRKFISFLTLLAVLACSLFCFVACGGGTATAEVVETTDTLVVIRVNETHGTATLYDVMTDLQEKGELQFEISADKMLKSINGKSNPADYSSCWMLYTSDSEMGNAEWGTYDYNGTNCASAILGGDALVVSVGAYYVWVYQSF